MYYLYVPSSSYTYRSKMSTLRQVEMLQPWCPSLGGSIFQCLCQTLNQLMCPRFNLTDCGNQEISSFQGVCMSWVVVALCSCLLGSVGVLYMGSRPSYALENGVISATQMPNSFFFFFFSFSTGLVQLYIVGLPLRSCRTIGAPSVQGSAQFGFFRFWLQQDSNPRPGAFHADVLPLRHFDPHHCYVLVGRGCDHVPIEHHSYVV